MTRKPPINNDGARIALLIEKAGITGRQFAELLGCPFEHLRARMNGEQHITMGFMERVIRAINPDFPDESERLRRMIESLWQDRAYHWQDETGRWRQCETPTKTAQMAAQGYTIRVMTFTEAFQENYRLPSETEGDGND